MAEQENTFIPAGSILLIVVVSLALFVFLVLTKQVYAGVPLDSDFCVADQLAPCLEANGAAQ